MPPGRQGRGPRGCWGCRPPAAPLLTARRSRAVLRRSRDRESPGQPAETSTVAANVLGAAACRPEAVVVICGMRVVDSRPWRGGFVGSGVAPPALLIGGSAAAPSLPRPRPARSGPCLSIATNRSLPWRSSRGIGVRADLRGLNHLGAKLGSAKRPGAALDRRRHCHVSRSSRCCAALLAAASADGTV